jgi:hypothetical protein
MHRGFIALMVYAATVVGCIASAFAQAPQWSELVAQGGEYVASDKRESMRAREHSATDLVQIAESVTAQELPAGAKVLNSRQRGSGPAIVLATVYQVGSSKRMLSVSVAQRNGGGALSLAHSVDPTLPEVASRVSNGGAALLQAAMQGQSLVARNSAPSPSPSPSSDPGSGPRAAAAVGSGLELERVLFDLDYKYGVGGAAYPVYKPVALFANGVACQCLDAAVEDINVEAVRRSKPKRVGKWRRKGSDYEVRWTGVAKPETLKTKTGPPKALPDASALRGKYQSISGGGNAALGGAVVTANVKDLHFFGDGSFAQSNARLMQSSSATVSGKRGKAGVWSLQDSTLTLSYADGREVRTSVFYSAKRKNTANFGRYGVLWIGGEGFKRVE